MGWHNLAKFCTDSEWELQKQDCPSVPMEIRDNGKKRRRAKARACKKRTLSKAKDDRNDQRFAELHARPKVRPRK